MLYAFRSSMDASKLKREMKHHIQELEGLQQRLKNTISKYEFEKSAFDVNKELEAINQKELEVQFAEKLLKLLLANNINHIKIILERGVALHTATEELKKMRASLARKQKQYNNLLNVLQDEITVISKRIIDTETAISEVKHELSFKKEEVYKFKNKFMW